MAIFGCVCAIWVGKMLYDLNKTVQICNVKIESGLSCKSSQVRVQVQVQQKIYLSPESCL